MATGPGDSGGLADELIVSVALDDQQLTTGVREGEAAIVALSQAVKALDAPIRKVGEGFGTLSAAVVSMGTETAAASEKAEAAMAAVAGATKTAGDTAVAAGAQGAQAIGGIAEGANVAEQGVRRVTSMLETLEAHAATLTNATDGEIRAFGAVRTLNEEAAASLGASAEQLTRLGALYDAVAAKAEARAAADREAAIAAEAAAAAEERAAHAGSTGAAPAQVQTGEQRAQIEALIAEYHDLAAATDATSAESVAAFQKATAAAQQHAAALNGTDEQLAVLKTAYTGVTASVAAYAAEQKVAAQTANVAAIEARVAALREEADQVTIVGAASVRAFRQAKIAAEEYIIALGATSTQLAALDAAEQHVIARAEAMGIRGVSVAGNIAAAQNHVAQKYGTVGIAVAGATDAMARSGEAGGAALKTFVASGAQMAFMFGPQGAIIGAIAVTALAIVDYFRHADKESEAAIARIEKRVLELRQKASGGVALFDFTAVAKQLEDANRRVLAAQRTLDATSGGDPEQDAVRAVSAQKLSAALKDQARFTEDLKAARLGVTEAAANDARTEAQSLASLIGLRQASAAQIERARALQAQFTAELAKTTGADHESIETRARAVAGLKALEDAFKGVSREQDRNAKSLEAVRDRAANVIAAFTQQFAELQTRASGDTAEKVVEPFDRMIEAIAKAQRAIPAGAEALKLKPEVAATYKALGAFLDQLTPKIQALRTAAVDRAAVNLFTDLNKQIAEFSATKLDDFNLKIAEQNRRTQEAIEATTTLGSVERAEAEEKLKQVKALQEQAGQAISATEAVEALFRAIDERSADGFLTPDELRQSNEQLDFLERSLRTTLDGLTKGSSAYLAVQKLLLEIEQKRLGISKEFSQQNPFKIPGNDPTDEKRQQEETIARQLRMVQTIGDAANAALNLARAFGSVNDATARVLKSVVDIGSGIARAFSGDIKGGLLQTASGLTSLISDAIDGPRQRRIQRERTDETNRSRIAEEQRNKGDLIGSNVTGNEFTSLSKGLDALLAGKGGDFRRIGDINGFFEKFGVSGERMQEIAKSLGITLDGSVGSFRRLREAIQQLDLDAFGKGFDGAMKKIDLLDRAAGNVSALDQLIERVAVLTGPDGAPALAKALGGIDLGTEGGRSKAIDSLVDQLKHVGDLKTEDLGGLTLDEFTNQILETIDRIRALDLTPLQKLNGALDIQEESFKLFGTAPRDQADQLIGVYKNAFADAFKDIDAGASLADVKAKAQAFFKSATADGKIDETERAILDGFESIIGTLEQSRDEVAAAAEKTAQEQAATRQKILDRAHQTIDLSDITDPTEQLKVLFEAYKKAFPKLGDLLGNVDLSDAKGIDAFKAAIRHIFDQINAATEQGAGNATETVNGVKDALEHLLGPGGAVDPKAAADAAASFQQLADSMSASGDSASGSTQALADLFQKLANGEDVTAELGGATLPEFISALLDLDGAADTAKQAIKNLADTLSQSFSDIDLNDSIAGITDKFDIASQKLAQFKIGNFDLKSEQGRAGAIAALQQLAAGNPNDRALKQLIAQMLGDIRSLIPAGSAPDGTPAGGEKGGGSTDVHGAVQTATVAQADQLLGIETTQLSVLRQILDAVRTPTTAIADIARALVASSLPAIAPPPLAARAASTAAPAVQRPLAITIGDGAVRLEVNNYGSVTQAEGVLDDASLRALARRLRDEIEQQLREASFNLGALRPSS